MFQCATTLSECPWLIAVWALLSAGTSIVCSPACGPYHGSNLNPDPPNRTHPMVKPWRGNEQRIMLACLPVVRLRNMKTKTCKYFHPLNHNRISRVFSILQRCWCNIHVASRRQPPAPHRWAAARNCQWCRPLRPKTSESTDCRKKKREEFDSHV